MRHLAEGIRCENLGEINRVHNLAVKPCDPKKSRVASPAIPLGRADAPECKDTPANGGYSFVSLVAGIEIGQPPQEVAAMVKFRKAYR